MIIYNAIIVASVSPIIIPKFVYVLVVTMVYSVNMVSVR